MTKKCILKIVVTPEDSFWWWHLSLDLPVPTTCLNLDQRSIRSQFQKYPIDQRPLSINTHPSALNFRNVQIQLEISAETLTHLQFSVFSIFHFHLRCLLKIEWRCGNFETKTNIHVIWKSVWMFHWYWEIWYSMKWEQLVYSQDYPGGGNSIATRYMNKDPPQLASRKIPAFFIQILKDRAILMKTMQNKEKGVNSHETFALALH